MLVVLAGVSFIGIAFWGNFFGFTNATAINGRPSYIGDEQVAFSYIGGPENIYAVGLDGSNPRVLIDEQYATFRPVWSPDRSHLLFTANIDGMHAIGRVDTDGSNFEIISDPALSWGDPDYNPEGTAIVFFTDEPHQRNLYIQDVSTGEASLLTDTADLEETSPRWSPDGSSIVFVGKNTGERDESDIWVIDPASGLQRNVTGTPAVGEFHPEWAPNGQQVVFIRAGEPEWSVVLLDINSQTEIVLARGGDGVVLSPHFTSDGTIVTFTRTSFDDNSGTVPTLVGYLLETQTEFEIAPATIFR